MANSSRLLILTASVGAGHTKAAEAIQKAVSIRYPQVHVDLVDTFSFAGPRLGKVIFGTYLKVIQNSPALYGLLYRKAEEKGIFASYSRRELNRVMSGFMAPALHELIQQNYYQGIVCTHPFPLGVLSQLKAIGKLKLPIYAVITDFSVHPFWVYPNVERYCVADNQLVNELIMQGISPEKVAVTGIPIDPNFSVKTDRDNLLLKLGLAPQTFTVAVMGGGLGMGSIEKVVTRLLDAQLPIQLVVVAGNNLPLYETLKERVLQSQIPCAVLPFVDYVPELMGAVDLLITKPGGLSATEAMVKGLAMVITGQIAGHEEKNTEFLLEKGVAVGAPEVRDVCMVVEELFSDREKLLVLQQAASKVCKPDSAFQVADVINKDLFVDKDKRIVNRGE